MEYFTQAVDKQPHVWNSEETVGEHFKCEGHRRHFVTTVVSHIQSLHDILRLWRMRLVDCSLHCPARHVNEDLYPLSPQQQSILLGPLLPTTFVPAALHSTTIRSCALRSYCTCVDKLSYFAGQAWNWKIANLSEDHRHLLNTQCRVLIATPTAPLANCYQPIFANDVTCETVHAAFRVPVTSTQQHTAIFP